MGSVKTAPAAVKKPSTPCSHACFRSYVGLRIPPPPVGASMSAGELIHVMTVIYLVLTAAIFALFGLIQKWVENL